MFFIYGIYFLLFCVSYRIFHIIKKYFFVSPELRQIPSLSLIQNVNCNKAYLTKEPFVHTVRDHVIETLSRKGIVKSFDVLVGDWIVVVSKPELMKEIFTKADAFQKWDRGNVISRAEMKFIGLNNILFEIKEIHLRHRRACNPAFSHGWKPELFGKLAIELFEEMDKACEKKSSLNAFQLTRAFTLDALGLAAFDYNFGLIRSSENDLEVAYNAAIRGVADDKYTLFPVLENIPLFRRPELMKQIDHLNEVILNIIEKRRKLLKVKGSQTLKSINDDDYNGPRDLLYFMLKAEESQESKARLTNEELMNNMKIFLAAGHDTTAIALAAAIYYLGVNQECQEKARQEVNRILGDEKKDIIPNLEQIKEFKYINMIIHEALRMHPPAPAAAIRVAQKDTTLGEYVIKKGTLVGLNIYTSHHSENVWEDSYKFKPERFANEKEATSQYFPFGGGNRICIGMNLSLAEQRVFLAMLVRKYSWKISKPNINGGDKIKVIPAILLLSVPESLIIDFERRY